MSIEGVLSSVIGTLGLIGIWFLEALNYFVHVILRPTPWNGTSVAFGYALWALQLITFWRLQAVDPGTVSPSWTAEALAGDRSATVCKRSGRLLPERAMYVRRAGEVILGLDHFCGWLGTPIGLYNRKLFILFVFYSCVFCLVGFAHSLFALLCALPDALLALPHEQREAAPASCAHLAIPAGLRDAEWRAGALAYQLFAALHALFGQLLQLLGAASAQGQLTYAVLLVVSVPANLATGAMLGLIAFEQLENVLRNRTTLEPRQTKYDVGALANWRQVFGDRPLTWLLPTVPRLSAADGYSWPHNPEHRIGGGRARDAGGAPRRAQTEARDGPQRRPRVAL